MNMIRKRNLLLTFTYFSLAGWVFTLPAHAADWPHWRGPNRNGISGESSGWEQGAWKNLQPAWKTNVGINGSAPLVVAGRIYTLGWDNEQTHVYCLDAVSGKEAWKQSFRCPKFGRHAIGDQGLYSGPSSAPEFDAQTGYLYTLSADGDLHCWDTRRDGAKVWHLNLYDEYGIGRRPQPTARRGTLRDYGYTTAPLVYQDVVIVEVGAKEGNLMAFAKDTGQRVWVSENQDPAGHTGGLVPLTVEGVPCVAVLTIYNLVVSRLDKGNEGQTVATYPWITDFANNIATPAVLGNEVVITSAYNKFAICKVRVTLKGAEKVWEQRHASGVCSPVIHKGNVYWAWRTVHCLDWQTGEPRWIGGNYGDAGSCIVTADDRLIIWAKRGDLALAETAERSPKQYQELFRQNNLTNSDVWPHVALADGRLICKDRNGNVLCFVIGK
ncbi:MAG: PQQ-binding-like beta-propeller repeat protein [Gemmataceae bacterium]